MSSGTQYKQRRIINWSEYNRALVNRGSITFWFPEDISQTWFFHGKKTGRGCFKTFSDPAIQTCLMVKAVFGLPLRALEGFLNSVFRVMGLPLTAPSYSLFTKRAGKLPVRIARRLPAKGAVDAVFDSSGLKVYGEGDLP